MMRIAVLTAMTLLGFARQAHAFCNPDTDPPLQCFLNGKEGVRTCQSNSQYGPCIVPPDPPPPSCTAQPKYKVLTVVYAPPGRAGGGSTSSVSYGSGSSLGSTVSSSDGFKQSYSVAATAKAGVFSDSSVSFSYSRNSVDTKAEDIKKTASGQLTQVGPTINGIDHDRDEIWLWLGPKLALTMPTPTTITWEPASNQVMDLQFVYVGDLKNPAQMAPGVVTRLQSYGITPADYPSILQADPFAFGDIAIDPTRYAQLNTTFPYEPPFAAGDPSPTLNFTATHTVTNTVTTTTTNEYSLGVTFSVGVGLTDAFKVALKTTDSWTWTDTNSRADAIGSSESAAVTVGGPTFGYTGPTDVAVYYDLMYKTFLFKFVTAAAAFPEAPFEGVVVSASRAPVAGQEVVVVDHGVSYRTFTNAAGEFRLFGPKAPTVQVRFGGVQAIASRSSDPLLIAVP